MRADDEYTSDPLAATAEASAQSSATPVRVRGPNLPSGTKVGRYVISSHLGAGGMGTVYAASDPELGRQVAIKLVHSHLAGMQARLLREGQAIARLRHPNVVTIHDVGEHEGNLFIAMELVAGSTLRQWLQQQRTSQEILDVFLAAGRGLAAAHAAGIVHRDFKPDNVLIDAAGNVVVTDFGLAREVAERAEQKSSGAKPQLVDVTVTGAYVGTPAYMSPEQFAGEPVGGRSDQFSFCIALYEALYRTRPFTGKTFDELQQAVLAGVVAPPPAGTQVPANVHAALARGLARDPAARHPTMPTLLAALAPKRRSRAWLALPFVGVAAGAAWLISLKVTPDDVKPPPLADPCTQAVAQIDRVWSEAARTAHRARVGVTAVVDDYSLFDRFAADWRSARSETCTSKQPARERCLDDAVRAFAATVEARKPGATEWPALPSLERCREGGPATAAVKTVMPGVRDMVLFSPDGTRYATLANGKLAIHSAETGLAIREHTIAEAGFVAAWPRPEQLALIDKTLQHLLTVDVESGTVGQTGFARNAQLVSADLQHALVIEGGDVVLESLVAVGERRTIGRLDPSRQQMLSNAWSTSGKRIALLLGPPSDAVLQIFDLERGTNQAIPFRMRMPEYGPGILLWQGDDRLLFVARGVWSLRLAPGGGLVEPPELRLPAPDATTSFRLEALANGRVLARRVVASQQVVRLKDGKPTAMPAVPDLRRIKGVTSDGKRLAVECEADVGWLELDGDNAYVSVGKREDVIAVDGERILVARGTELVAIDADRGERKLAELPPSTMRRTVACAAAGGTCGIVSWGGATAELRLLLDDAVGPPAPPPTSGRTIDLAVRPDGYALAFAGAASFVTVQEIRKSGERELWRLPLDAPCGSTTYVAWSPKDSSLFVGQGCQGSTSRLVHLRGPKQAEPYYTSKHLIAGLAVLPSGEVILNERQLAADLVVIDSL